MERTWYPDGLDAEELAFQRLYGPWKQSTPAEAREVLDGYDGEWWIAGGWAIEAFTGVRREHEDVDVSLWRRDIEKLRLHLKGKYDLWSNAGGQLRPLTDQRPDQPADADQIWLRKHALSAWEFDLVVNPDRDGRWVFRRDPELDYDLHDISWVTPDGIRCLNPEIALAYKAKQSRPKDEQDLAATLPLLTDERRTWLADMIEHLHPGHAWIETVRAEPLRR
ncbi:nucleotidyltransferase domain-containing protein [Kribbella sp. NPDC049227]|uniref:nucleotidyltransferase domain-containing protein n=1 Tax=Kribbella sp. NPDC049227 TaxID=3364113 RepID=UPI0037149995